MKVIQRYIFSQIFLYSLISVGVFLFVLLTGNAIREVLSLVAGGKMSLLSLVQILALICLYVLSFALPMGLLCSILMVFGRMSANKEIVALKASGVSLFSLTRPVFLFAILATLLSLSVNFYFAPIAKSTYKEKLKYVLLDNPIRFFQTNTFVDDFPRYRIFVGERSENSLKDVWVWELDTGDRAQFLLKAKSGNVSFDSSDNKLNLTLFSGSVEKRNPEKTDSIPQLNTAFFDHWAITIPLDSLLDQFNFKEKASYLSYNELQERLASLDPIKDKAQYINVKTQIQKNYAMAFSVLALVIIAIPLGIKVSRSETYANVGLAVILSLAYYFLVIVATWFEPKPEFRPDLLVWIPNIIFFAIGSCLLYRLSRR